MSWDYTYIRFLAFSLCLMSLLSCASEFNPATGRQETLIYGDDKEVSLGASVAQDVEKRMTLSNAVDVNERVEKILKRLVAVCDRQDLVYTIRVIDDDVTNAFSLPGGWIYLYQGLIDKVKTDDELAAVIAHELAHIVAKHAIKRIGQAYGAMVLEGGAMASGHSALAAGIDLTASSIIFANSRDDEFEADYLGVKYLRLAGYKTPAMSSMLNILLLQQSKESPRPLNYWRTHPYLPQRIARANAASRGQAEFRDYLNTVGEDR